MICKFFYANKFIYHWLGKLTQLLAPLIDFNCNKSKNLGNNENKTIYDIGNGISCDKFMLKEKFVIEEIFEIKNLKGLK